ncbi:hypothetical protein TNCT_208441 [Trichonephila clavata]|uniref:Uncharacterized protein n=1 Tax=Trichonephila clavata TaxID=2740835 RepID=A0A8X6J5I3_TRICU|nr:hypothetical protein TNCT_208441 [Trichonephila clavata]
MSVNPSTSNTTTNLCTPQSKLGRKTPTVSKINMQSNSYIKVCNQIVALTGDENSKNVLKKEGNEAEEIEIIEGKKEIKKEEGEEGEVKEIKKEDDKVEEIKKEEFELEGKIKDEKSAYDYEQEEFEEEGEYEYEEGELDEETDIEETEKEEGKVDEIKKGEGAEAKLPDDDNKFITSHDLGKAIAIALRKIRNTCESNRNPEGKEHREVDKEISPSKSETVIDKQAVDPEILQLPSDDTSDIKESSNKETLKESDLADSDKKESESHTEPKSSNATGISDDTQGLIACEEDTSDSTDTTDYNDWYLYSNNMNEPADESSESSAESRPASRSSDRKRRHSSGSEDESKGGPSEKVPRNSSTN